MRGRHRDAAKPLPELVYRLTAWPVVLNAEAGILSHRRQAGARDCHKRQELYLARRMRELKAEVAQEPAEAIAPELQAPLSILSWAFSSSVHMLLGVQLPDYLRESRYRVGGERLLACVRDMDFDGNLGDMQVTEAWIKELDLERLLDW